MTSPYSAERANEANDKRDSLQEFSAAINTILETLIDGIRGFNAAADQTEGTIATRLSEMARTRHEQTEQIIRIAADADMDPVTLDSEGTVTGKLHRAWLGVRDAVQGDDGVLASAINGEQHALKEINDVLDGGIPNEMSGVVQRISATIEENLAELGGMRATD